MGFLPLLSLAVWQNSVSFSQPQSASVSLSQPQSASVSLSEPQSASVSRLFGYSNLRATPRVGHLNKYIFDYYMYMYACMPIRISHTFGPTDGRFGRRGRGRGRLVAVGCYYSCVLGEVFCKIKTLRGLFAMFRSQSDSSKIQI